jgi:hypothetical protein
MRYSRCERFFLQARLILHGSFSRVYWRCVRSQFIRSSVWSDETVDGQALSASDLNVSPQIADRAETFLHGLPFEPNSVAMVQLCGPYVLAGERDLRRARDHMNLSEWHEYRLNQQEKLLANIASPSKPVGCHCSSTR